MIKNIALVLATATIGFTSLAACGGDDDKAAGPSAPPVSSAPGTPGTVPPTAPDPSATTAPAPDVPASSAPAVGGSQVIMIDPSGKKYSRSDLVQMARGMAGDMGKKLPPNFCARSYEDGIKGGGKFPAGRQAFIDACKEGMGELG